MNTNLHINTKYKEEDTTDEPVSPSGQYFNSKTLSVCILGILESEIPIDDSNTFPLLEQIFLPINPRFSSIMVHDKKGVKHWKRVEVKLEEHVHAPKYPNGLSIQEYNDYFDKYLTEISIKPLPKDKPMWEIHFFKYPTIKSAGQMIFKFHHALGDGFSLMGALLSCMQRADNPSIPLTFPSFQPSSKTKRMDDVGCIPKTMSAIYNTACDFGWSVVKSSMICDDITPIRSGVQGVEFHPIQISTVELSLDHVKQVKNAIGATINDVITGIIFLGTRLYMQATGKEFSNSETTALVLLNTRNIDGYKSIKEMLNTDSSKTKWGNQFAFLHVGLPSLVNDQSFNPLTFISQAQKIIKRKRNSLAVYLTGQSLEFLRKCRGPEASAEFIHSTLQKSTMAISNMIGPVEKMSLANHPCKGLYFMVVGVPQSLTITIMSYMKTLRIAVGVEKGYIDAQKFNSSLENAFQLIYKAAMNNI